VLTICLFSPWAIATWAPSAFLGVEVNKLAEESGGYRRLSNIEMELPSLNEQGLLGDGDSGAPGAPAASSAGELSGIYFGILNIYTTLPQFVGTFISMIVFAVLEPGKSRELGGEEDTQPSVTGPNAISVCLFIGAMSTVVASFMTRKLRTL
jgi:solute carrier family 45 protein 1/2/4